MNQLLNPLLVAAALCCAVGLVNAQGTLPPLTLPPGAGAGFPNIPRYYYCLTQITELNKVDGVEQSFYLDATFTCYWQEPVLIGQLGAAGGAPAFPSTTELDNTLKSLSLFFEPAFLNQRDLTLSDTKRYVFQIVPPAMQPTVAAGLPNPFFPLAVTPWLAYSTRLSGLFKATMKLHDFPFDEQTVWINITAFTDVSAARFAGPWRADFDATREVEDVIGWSLLGSSTHNDSFVDESLGLQSPMTATSLTLKRSPEYYINKIILGVALLTMMSHMTFAINPRDTNRPVAAMTAFLGIVTYLFVISTDVPKVAYLTRMDRFVNLSFYFVFGDFTMHLIFYVIVTAADAAEAKAIAAEEARKKKEDDYKVRRRGTATVKVNPIESSPGATPNDDDPAVKDDAFPEDAAPADAVDEGPDGWWNPVRSNLRALDFILLGATMIGYAIAVFAILSSAK